MILLLSILFQVPLPPATVWEEYPLLGAIVLCFALAFTSIFIALRWMWGVYVIERDKDRAWRAEQNQKRENALAEQNEKWRIATTERDKAFQENTVAQQQVLKDISINLINVSNTLNAHDEQAREILQKVTAIDERTKPQKGGSNG